MKKNKNKVVKEDAVIGTSSSAASSGIVSHDTGISTNDILGKCKHSKTDGYIKDGCFHIPKNVFNKTQSREIFTGKKRKQIKNNYSNILQEADIKISNLFLNESDNNKKILSDLWKYIRSTFKTMLDVKKWFSKRKHAMKQYIDNNIDDKNAKMLANKAYICLEYITQNNQVNEASFGKIIKVIVCIYLLALFIPGALTGISIGIQHGSIFSAITNGIAGGVINTWSGIVSLLLHLPVIGNIIALLI